MKKILISDAVMNEILNKDLSLSTDNEVQGYGQVKLGGFKDKGSSQMTTDDFAKQAIEPHKNFGMNGSIRTYIREEGEDEYTKKEVIGDLSVLDTYGERALSIDVVNLSKALSVLQPEQAAEIIPTAIYYLIKNVDWSKIGGESKDKIKEYIR